MTRTVYDKHGRVELSTDQFLLPGTSLLGQDASPPVRATRTLYDNQGRTHITQRYADVIIRIATGGLVVDDPGVLLTTSETIYNAKGQTARTIAADGQITDFEYDLQGRQVATIGHPLPAEEVGLGAQYPGQLVRHRTQTEYNQYGQRSREWSNLRQVEDAAGNIVHVDDTTAPNARKTEFEYDEFGNLVKTVYADGSYVLVRYDALGRQTAEMQQTAGTVAAEWSETEKSFIVTASNPIQRIPTKLYEYEEQGRLSAVELPAVPDPQNNNTLTRPRYEYGYNEQGSQTLIRDPLGRETRFTFDAQGRQLTRTLPLGFGPDGIFNTADDSTLPEGDFTERFEYNDRGQQTLHVSFEGVVAESVYDNTAAGGGRLKEKRFFDNLTQYANGTGIPRETWTYKYDAFGREIEVRQDDGTTVRVVKGAYDDEGRLTNVDAPEGVVTYAYDALGRKTAMRVYPAGADPNTATPERVTTYGYDALSRLKSVSEDLDPASTSDAPLDTSYGYDLLGNLRRTDLPNGVVTENTFDELNRLDVMTHYAPDATPEDLSDNDKHAQFDYTVRADGKRTGVTETYWLDSNGDTVPEPHVIVVDWTYDEVGRLTDEVFNHFDDALDQTEHFVYDLVGNRLSLTKDQGNNASIDEAITYSYDANDRLIDELLDIGNNGTTDQTTTYGWAHTQQARKTVVDNATDQTKSKIFFDYDLQGRMSQVETETWTNGAVTHRERVTYDYDATGIRIGSLHEVSPDGDTTFETSTRTEFLVDHHNLTGYQQVLTETSYDGQGHVVKTIEYTIGHDEIAQTVTEFDTLGAPTGQTTHIFGHDGHGSVRVLSDMAAAIAQLYAYEAYGRLLSIHTGAAQFVSNNPADALTTVLQNGEHFDARINHLWLRARWYDPQTGRFNRLDDFFGNLQDPQSFHKYLFTHGDPINGADPTGLSFASLVAPTFFTLNAGAALQLFVIRAGVGLAFGIVSQIYSTVYGNQALDGLHDIQRAIGNHPAAREVAELRALVREKMRVGTIADLFVKPIFAGMYGPIFSVGALGYTVYGWMMFIGWIENELVKLLPEWIGDQNPIVQFGINQTYGVNKNTKFEIDIHITKILANGSVFALHVDEDMGLLANVIRESKRLRFNKGRENLAEFYKQINRYYGELKIDPSPPWATPPNN